MKSRIAQKFEDLKSQKQKAFTTFITAGDPNLENTEKMIFALEAAGVSLIELGVPFSDPMADGPVIQKANERAIKNKVTLKQVLALVARVRKKTDIPIILMGYANPFYQMGYKEFGAAAQKAGVDGVIIVDLPVEESSDFQTELKAHGIDLIFLLSPLSDESRIAQVAKLGSGFIYYVSYTGTTGSASLNVSDVKKHVTKIRKQIDLPVQVGFGISKPEHVKALSPVADGVVVGSELVRFVEKNFGKKGWLKGLEEKAKRLVSAL